MFKNMNNLNNSNIAEFHRQESLKRRWHDSFYTRLLTTPTTPPQGGPPASSSSMFMGKRLDTVDLVPNVVPSVTVVLEGRSICHRVNLHKHTNYHSLAKALRYMFADTVNVDHNHNHNHNHNNVVNGEDGGVDLSNAVPGHIVAYEDMENDLLLAGDLNWKDFVRVAKRIRILPIKSNTRKQRTMIKH